MKKLLALFALVILSSGAGLAQTGFSEKKVVASDLEYYTSNYGVFGWSMDNYDNGAIWPKGSTKGYLKGAGFWFGAVKNVSGTDTKIIAMTLNPYNMKSGFAPGRIEDGQNLDATKADGNQVYVSGDYYSDGSAKKTGDPAWALWNSADGWPTYVHNPDDRNKTKYPLGPAFRTTDDAFCTFKDTDPKYRHVGSSVPLGLQVEQFVLCPSTNDVKDQIILQYNIINKSGGELKDCWLAPFVNPSLENTESDKYGDRNDSCIFVKYSNGSNFALTTTASDEGESNHGIMAVSLVNTPAVDANKYIRHDKRTYETSERLPISTFRYWDKDNEKMYSDAERYAYIAAGTINQNRSVGSVVYYYGVGPFNMRDGDTAKFTLIFMFAENTSENLLTRVTNAMTYYQTKIANSIDEGNYYSLRAVAYPNPSKGVFTLTANEAITETNVKVIGLDAGNTITVKGENVGDALRVDLSAMVPGAYIIELNNNGKVHNCKVIIER